MKIAVNINPLLGINKSGIGYYETELLKAYLKISNDDIEIHYFEPKNKGITVLPDWLNNYEKKSCKMFPMSLYKLICSVISFPYKWLYKGVADVTVFFNYFLPPGMKGKRVVVVYDMVVNDYPKTMNIKTRISLQLTLKASIKRADRIITISEFSKKRIMECYSVDEDKISVIACAADKNRFYPAAQGEILSEKISEKYKIPDKYYLYLGTLEPRKNIERLIEAYSEAKKHAKIPKLVIAGGKGWLFEEIFKRVEELSLKDDVIFTGYVDDNDVPELMRHARAFCFPSLYEGFGMPPLEAMSCGVPVIVSDCSSLPEVVGVCGIQVNPYSVEEISDALIKMTDSDFVAEQRRLSVKQAEQFSWEKSALILKNMLEKTQVHSISRLASYAISNNLIVLD